MSSSSGGKNVVTKKSGHKVATPPEISNNPPVPPGPGPVPTPYVIVASSSTGQNTSGALTVDGAEVLTDKSHMDADAPANAPSRPTGGDLQTFTVQGKVPVVSGSSTLTSDGNPVACTSDRCAVNVMTPKMEQAQMTGVLLQAVDVGMVEAVFDGSGGDADGKVVWVPAQTASDKGAPGGQSAPDAAAVTTKGHPVAVVSGAVVEEVVDLRLPGAIPLTIERNYSSVRARETSLLGTGGWAFSLDRWVAETERGLSVRGADGCYFYFAALAAGESSYHRRSRQTLTSEGRGRYRLEVHDERLTYHFAPALPGGRALLERIRDPYGHVIELQYEGGRLARVIDTCGREIVLRHDEGGRVTRIEVWAAPPPAPGDARGEPPAPSSVQTWVDYAYDGAGRLVRAADALGHAERFAYGADDRIAAVTLKNGVTFRYAYDAATGRCVKTWGDGGLHLVELAYERDRDTVVTTTSGTNEARRYVGTLDGYTRVEQTLDGDWARILAHDADGYVVEEKNAAGEATKHAYDARGHRVATTDPAGNVTRFTWARDVLQKRVDPDGLETRYDHDGFGAVVGATSPSGYHTTLERDGEGRVVRVFGGDGKLFGFAYDSHHNVVEETDARGGRTRYRHDALGRPVERVDALGRRTRVEYDRLGQPVRVVHADGTETRAEYGPLGRATRHVDALGHETRLEYSGTGVVSRLVEPGGQVWRFSHDRDERLVRIENPRRETYDFVHDRVGRVVEERPFDGRRIKYSYDRGGRLSRIDQPDGTFRALAYDPLGNVVEESSPHGVLHFRRDALGRLEEAVVEEVGGKVVTTFERDALGRVVAESQNGRTLRFGYDARGFRTERVLPSGATTRYRHDVLGALAEVEHEGHRLSFERDVLGRETVRRFGRGRVGGVGVGAGGGGGDFAAEIRSGYDAMDRLAGQDVAAPGPLAGEALRVLAQRRYGYDASGRVREIADGRWGTTSYGYDPLGRLVEAQRGAYREVFEYDVTGSLQNVLGELAELGRVAPWRVEKGNVLEARPGIRYESDEGRRRTKKITLDEAGREQVTQYIWDCRDRLREVRLPSGEKVRYTYDAFARLVRKDVLPKLPEDRAGLVRRSIEAGRSLLPKARVTHYLFDGNALAADEVAGEGEPRERERVFVHAPGTVEPLLQAEQGEVFAVVADHLGMPKELVDIEGRVAWAASHSAWGRVLETWRDPESGRGRGRERERGRPVESPFRLLGQYEDREVGLSYTRYRWFDAETGRWLSPDPLGIAGGANLMAFDGAPTVEVDPWGLCAAGKKPPVIVIGEDQARVAAFAKAIGAREIQSEWRRQGGMVYTPPLSDAQTAESIAFNRSWIRARMGEGATILDIGRDPTRVGKGVPMSPWYKAELQEIESRSYPTLKTTPKGAQPGLFVNSEGVPR